MDSKNKNEKYKRIKFETNSTLRKGMKAFGRNNCGLISSKLI